MWRNAIPDRIFAPQKRVQTLFFARQGWPASCGSRFHLRFPHGGPLGYHAGFTVLDVRIARAAPHVTLD